ncbi:MAG: hypothetical protein ABI693_28450, partial [Bryobacteraceae bacterium]
KKATYQSVFGLTSKLPLAQAEAKALGSSLAEFVRRAIRDALPVEDSPWMKYAGFVESGDSGSSQSLDDIVYGAKD